MVKEKRDVWGLAYLLGAGRVEVVVDVQKLLVEIVLGVTWLIVQAGDVTEDVEKVRAVVDVEEIANENVESGMYGIYSSSDNSPPIGVRRC